MFIVALFTIAKSWKQPKLLKVVYLPDGILFSHKKGIICYNVYKIQKYAK
jgi:hypothetical protein